MHQLDAYISYPRRAPADLQQFEALYKRIAVAIGGIHILAQNTPFKAPEAYNIRLIRAALWTIIEEVPSLLQAVANVESRESANAQMRLDAMWQELQNLLRRAWLIGGRKWKEMKKERIAAEYAETLRRTLERYDAAAAAAERTEPHETHRS